MKRVKITESQLRHIVRESINHYLNESNPDKGLTDAEKEARRDKNYYGDKTPNGDRELEHFDNSIKKRGKGNFKTLQKGLDKKMNRYGSFKDNVAESKKTGK